MALVDMNIRDDDGPSPSAVGDYNQSPCIYLTDAQCKALGINTPPRAGTKVHLQALCTVESVTESVDDDADDPDVRMTLCLDYIELSAPTQSKPLYGADDV